MSTKKTIKGKYCSPQGNKLKEYTGDSCYTKDQLLQIARSYNIHYSNSIPLKGNKLQLWEAIEQRMVECNSEWCWMDKVNLHLNDPAFRPVRPEGRNQWLSTMDIQNVLKQYESIYPEFLFIGPVPIDFCALGIEICKLDLSKTYKKNKRCVGVVFNTDPSTEPGKHWICMFIDMRKDDPRLWEINYYDSFGQATLAKPIIDLVKHFERQIAGIIKQKYPSQRDVKVIKKLNCSNSMCTHRKQHQQNNTECGVYCIHFIVERLHGRTWEELVNSNMNDNLMLQQRKKFFRPHSGTDHGH